MLMAPLEVISCVTVGAGKLVNSLPSPEINPPVMLPVVEIVFDPNPANNVVTLLFPYVGANPVSWLPSPMK